MQSSKPIQKLLQSEMNRREFLGFMGAAALTVLGVSSMLRGLQGITGQRANHGYGASSYGGGSEPVRGSIK